MKLTKIAAGSLAAVTLLAGVAVSSQAEARGWRLGAGIATGVIVGGIIASRAYAEPAPVYVEEPSVRCKYVERYDAFGNYRGTRKLCVVD